MTSPEDVILRDANRIRPQIEEVLSKNIISGIYEKQYYSVTIVGYYLREAVLRVVNDYRLKGWVVECTVNSNRSPVTTDIRLYVPPNYTNM